MNLEEWLNIELVDYQLDEHFEYFIYIRESVCRSKWSCTCPFISFSCHRVDTALTT